MIPAVALTAAGNHSQRPQPWKVSRLGMLAPGTDLLSYGSTDNTDKATAYFISE
jgi:hypothetical protein